MNKTYYVARSGIQLGPYTWEVLHQGLRNGQFQAHDFYWTEGMAAWEPLTQLQDFPGSRGIEGLGIGTEPSQLLPNQYASWWLRICAYFLDVLVFVGADALLRLFFHSNLRVVTDSSRGFYSSSVFLSSDYTITTVAEIFYYMLLMGGKRHATLGMRLMGIHVLQESGKPCTYAVALANYFCFGFSVCLTLGLCLFVPWLTERRQGLHDLITRTVYLKDDSSSV